MIYMGTLRKWSRFKAWIHEHLVALIALSIACLSLIVDGVQVMQIEAANRNMAEQQRARLSLGLELEKIDDPPVFRIVGPLQIGGTTGAQQVTVKNYVTSGEPRQSNFISSVEVDWDKRDGHFIGSVAPTEEGRRITADPLTHQQFETILSEKESLYFIARLEYCDVQNECYYFMRCAELGSSGIAVLTYCGTRTGRLP